MPRPRAADHAERRAAIAQAAAELYAEKGFAGASAADLARALGVSKALVYHYYASKEAILYEVMDEHLRALDAAAEKVLARRLAPEATLRELARAFMRLYVGAVARHKVLLNELDALPADQRVAIVARQRRLIAEVETLLTRIQPALTAPLARPAAMLFFGMINWTHTWFRAGGGASAQAVADLATDIALEGLRGLPNPYPS